MKPLIAVLIGLVVPSILLAQKQTEFVDNRPTIDSLIGIEFQIDDGWAGQSFALEKKKKKYSVVWKIYGSGIFLVSEVEYPVEVQSKWQYRFQLDKKEKKSEIKVSIVEQGEVRVYLNGLRIYAVSDLE